MKYFFLASFIFLAMCIISSCNKKEGKENTTSISSEHPSPDGLGISRKRSDGVNMKLEVSNDSIYIINDNNRIYSRLDYLHQNLDSNKEFLIGEIFIVIYKNSSVDFIRRIEKKINEYHDKLLEAKTFQLYNTSYNLLSDEKKKEINEICANFRFVFSNNPN